MRITSRWILVLGAALLATTCSRVQPIGEDTLNMSREVVFQVARYHAVTKADSDYKDNYANVPFGAYSWYKGLDPADNTAFMVNQAVGYDTSNDRWATTGATYYWPQSGSLDFICYSPYSADGKAAPLPVITENNISYPMWNVAEHPGLDVMYADKVTGLTNNATTYYYGGVPTLFHHALSFVTFQVKAAYLQKKAPTGDTTRWEIDLNSVQLKDIHTTGSLTMNLNKDGSSWNLPSPAVWDSDGVSKLDTFLNTDGVSSITGTAQTLGDGMYVLPQSLDGGQSVVLNVTIRTYHDDGTGEKLLFRENSINVTSMLKNGSLPAWGMNQKITYVFTLAPSQAEGTGVDLDEDGIEDVDPVSVYFDPAVGEWQKVTVSAGINL